MNYIEVAHVFSRTPMAQFVWLINSIRKMRDEVTGLTSLVEVSKRVKSWWFTNSETKKVAVQIFYGNKVIDLAKGKNAVEVANGVELIAVLSKLQEAVLDGSLDSQIEQAADSVKARFAK
jgi:hypothetical protein